MTFVQHSTFAFVDVETTGASAPHDRVIEVGIIRVENGQIVGQMNTLLDPGVHIPADITTITGITSQDIETAPYFSDVSDEITELLKDAVFVAHNARFDYAFMKHEFRRLGLPFSAKTLCTVKLSRALYPERARHNLDSVIQFLNISVENRHRAYDDAKVLHDFLVHIEKTRPHEEVDPIITNFLKAPSLPTQIDKTHIEALHDGPGVYLMYGDQDTLLYIGKSVDVKARVLSHFYNDFESAKDIKLSREVRRVEAIKTAGDVGASLLESTLIKTRLPIYNTFLRQNRSSFVLVQSETPDGYYTVKTMDPKEIDHSDHHKILAVFRSKKNIDEWLSLLSKEHMLCKKLLGIEKGKGRCFGTQIGTCNGACEKEEPPFKYNVRFVQAFSGKRVPQWPFPGSIGVKESFDGVEEVHVVYNWCYLGTMRNEHDRIEDMIHTIQFDWDAYKILYRFVQKHVKSHTIIHLPAPSAHSSPTVQQ